MISILLINSSVVIISVIFHYEFLYRYTHLMPKLNIRHRGRIVLGVCGALVAHSVEIWIFAIAYYFMYHHEDWGTLAGNFDGGLMDCVYFSFTTYSTLGFGDIYPDGDLRYLVGIESLTGLVLIAWTASFLFGEMQKQWKL